MTGVEFAGQPHCSREYKERYILASGWGEDAIDAVNRGDEFVAGFSARIAARYALSIGNRREEVKEIVCPKKPCWTQ